MQILATISSVGVVYLVSSLLLSPLVSMITWCASGFMRWSQITKICNPLLTFSEAFCLSNCQDLNRIGNVDSFLFRITMALSADCLVLQNCHWLWSYRQFFFRYSLKVLEDVEGEEVWPSQSARKKINWLRLPALVNDFSQSVSHVYVSLGPKVYWFCQKKKGDPEICCSNDGFVSKSFFWIC